MPREILDDNQINDRKKNDQYWFDNHLTRVKCIALYGGVAIGIIIALGALIFIIAVAVDFYNVIKNDKVLLFQFLWWLIGHSVSVSLGAAAPLLWYFKNKKRK